MSRRSALIGVLNTRVPYANIITNGNFANTSWWVPFGCSFIVQNNVGTFLATATNGRIISPTLSVTNGNKYYVLARVQTLNNQLECQFYKGVSPFTTITSLFHSGSGNYETLSAIGTATESASNYNLRFINRATSGWADVNIKEVMIVNLTTTFGAGNEPTKAWCDVNLPFVVSNGIAA